MYAGRYKPYPAYEASGVEWLGDIPEGWEVKKLKFSATYNDEVISENTPADWDIKYVDIGSVSADSGINEIQDFEFGKAPSRARRIVKQGDVLVSTVRTYLKAVAPVIDPPPNLIASTGFAVIRPKDELKSPFAAYALRTEGYVGEIVSRSVGVSYPAINASDAVQIFLPLPTATEQTQIAAFLDDETAKIDALIAKQERLIQLLEEKRQAVISLAVTKGLNPDAPLRPSGIDWLGDVPAHWKVFRVKHLARTISKGTTPSTVGGDLTDTGVRFLKAENIGKSIEVSSSPEFYISQQMDEKISRSRLCANDVLVIIAGATTGLASVISQDLLPANTNQAVSFVRPLDPENAYFVLHWLSTEFAQSSIWLGAVQAAQPNLSMESLGNIPVALPPVGERDDILLSVSRASARFTELLKNARSAITLLKERRTALISAAVTGKIDVRDWQPPKDVSDQATDQKAFA